MTGTLFQLFDALPPHIEAALRASIQRFGVLVPVTIDQEGNILDGHHRRRIAEDLGVGYDRLIRVCADDDERREIARTLNADRRQLTEEQRREVVAELRQGGHSVRAIAGALGIGSSTVDRDVAELSRAGQLDGQPDRIVGLDGKSRPSRRPQVIARDDHEQERAQTALAVVGDTSGRRTLDVKRLERVAREQEAERRSGEFVEERTSLADIDIRHGDFRKILDDIPEGSVDAIITDPPYPRQFWDLYDHLGIVARTLLKPDGVLAVMTGTRLEMLSAVDYQIGQHMRRRHRGVYLTPGQRWRDQIERVATGYKPILIYAHPESSDLRWINDDVFTSEEFRQDDRFHHWGQSESGFACLINRLTEPGALVVDPFLGGGTTAVVCRDLGRRFIGCDVDAGAVATTRERIS